MKSPSILRRFFGYPVIACGAGVWFVLILKSWSENGTFFFNVILTGCFAVYCFSSWRKVRAHKAWLRQWNQTGQAPEELAGESTAERGTLSAESSGSHAFIKPFLVAVGIPILSAVIPHPAPGLALLLVVVWLVSLVLLLRALILRRKGKKNASAASPGKTNAASAAAVVSWTIGLPSSTPSRDSILSQLPDYALSAMGLRRGNH